MTLQKEIR